MCFCISTISLTSFSLSVMLPHGDKSSIAALPTARFDDTETAANSASETTSLSKQAGFYPYVDNGGYVKRTAVQ